MSLKNKPDASNNDVRVPGALMRAEIAEQPQRWRELVRNSREQIDAAAALITEGKPELIVMVARGSSDHAANYAQYLIHAVLGIPVALATPASVHPGAPQLRYPGALAIAISQSGRSPDLIATVESIRDGGTPVLSLTNNPGSPLAELASVAVDLSAGPELSVAATKTYTSSLLALVLIVLRAAGEEWAAIEPRVDLLADEAEAFLAAPAGYADARALLAGRERVIVVGRGVSMSSAREGALKLMETNAIAASGWSAADAIHGPLGQVTPGTVAIVLTGTALGRDSVIEFAEKAHALGADVLEVGGGVLPFAAAHITLPQVPMGGVPLLETIPLQQLALELAIERGLDPDSPAGLNKVTLTT
ncbi:SIS domain-containing protein [Mycetocola tolaasinivorans]|uniref:SIS domain-containing protein n=1 Tax=Mycetocola tolaasinivorans TaxID=76635 RepID=A0A3L7A4H6_9MICO|nr:SIS domain-containing protein [Mycetocola tolaasinivorans]RLP75199.1 SIS domain-containing protein [Mycetocola tolaasinivorans]